MLISYFIYFSIQTWWDFNAREFSEKQMNSFNKPIFNLCYSRYCPHCHGLPEGFRNFAKTLGDRDDIYISMIDCAVSADCGYFRIHGTPNIRIVLGDNVRYWPETGERGPNGWTRFINSWIFPSLRRIYNQTELDQAILEPTDGGTTFFLEVPSESHPWVSKIRNLTVRFKIYNDTFVYRVNETVKKATLYAYRSKYCVEKYDGLDLGLVPFIKYNKFGIYHRYDFTEWDKLHNGHRNNAIFIVKKELTQSQKDSLLELSKDYCKGYNLGWAHVDEHEARILKMANVAQYELPLLKAVNFNPPNLQKFKGPLRAAGEMNFLPIERDRQYFKENMPGLYFAMKITAISWIIYILYVLTPIIFVQSKEQRKPSPTTL